MFAPLNNVFDGTACQTLTVLTNTLFSDFASSGYILNQFTLSASVSTIDENEKLATASKRSDYTNYNTLKCNFKGKH